MTNTVHGDSPQTTAFRAIWYTVTRHCTDFEIILSENDGIIGRGQVRFRLPRSADMAGASYIVADVPGLVNIAADGSEAVVLEEEASSCLDTEFLSWGTPAVDFATKSAGFRYAPLNRVGLTAMDAATKVADGGVGAAFCLSVANATDYFNAPVAGTAEAEVLGEGFLDTGTLDDKAALATALFTAAPVRTATTADGNTDRNDAKYWAMNNDTEKIITVYNANPIDVLNPYYVKPKSADNPAAAQWLSKKMGAVPGNTPVNKYNTAKMPYWCNGFGFKLIDECHLHLGTNPIDSLYSEFIYIWSELTRNVHKKMDVWHGVAVDEDGKTDVSELQRRSMRAQRIYVPLPFSYTRWTGCSLPLIGLAFQEVEIRLKTAQLSQLICNSSKNAAAAGDPSTGYSGETAISFDPEVAPGVQADATTRPFMGGSGDGRDAVVYQMKTGTVSAGTVRTYVRPGQEAETHQQLREALTKSTEHVAKIDGSAPVNELEERHIALYLMQRFTYLSADERKRYANTTGFRNLMWDVSKLDLQYSSGGSKTLNIDINNDLTEMMMVCRTQESEDKNDWFCFGKNDRDALTGTNLPLLSSLSYSFSNIAQYDRDEIMPSIFSDVMTRTHHTSQPRQPIYNIVFGESPEEYQPSGAAVPLSRLDGKRILFKPVNADLEAGGRLTVLLFTRTMNLLKYAAGMAGKLLASSN